MISICILNWNCCETLKQMMQVFSGIKIQHEIIIFDQNSNDGSIEYLQKISEEQQNIRVIFSKLNIGNSVSRNIMINQSKYEYVLLIDSDIVPIKDSVEQMLLFLKNNTNFAFIGYDFYNYTRNLSEASEDQNSIKIEDIQVMTDYSKESCLGIPLCQYGLFRKEMLIKCPFPEFYPFNEEGWGSEDNLVGYAWKENNLGQGAIIKNKYYFHNKNSSAPLLGQDNFGKRYLIRYTYLSYFQKFLSSQQKIEALQTKILPKTKLKLNKYFFKKHNNLGDIATNYILEKIFPFFEFDFDNKENLLMFGGSIFNHLHHADKLHNTKFKNVIYFGTGLSCERELNEAIEQIKNLEKFSIFPRGHKTAGEFAKKEIPYVAVLGDVLQLFACFDVAINKNIKTQKCLCVKDSYSTNGNPGTFVCDKIKVAQNEKNRLVPYVGLENFIKMIKIYNKVYSSQVHPFFISAALGKPCHLFPKDWRAEDLRFFDNLKFEMSSEDCAKLRKEIFKKGISLVNHFTDSLKPYA